ncbi:MAG: NPCBM/NEW2 domain-containing protein [Planctomycetota bacterium]
MKTRAAILVMLFLCGGAAGSEFVTIEDKKIAGELEAVTEKGAVSIASEGATVTVPADELKRIRFGQGREAEEPLAGVVAYFPRGDRITGKLAAASKTHVTVSGRALGEVRIPLESLLAVEFRRAGERPNDAARMREQMLGNRSKNDVSFSANGDQMPGILVGFGKDQVVLQTELGEVKLKTARLFGVSFAGREHKAPPPSLLAVARCTDGSVVTGELLPSKSGVRLRLVAGPTVQVPTRRLVEILFKQGKLVYLSDLEPVKATTRPYFGGDHTWPYRKDESYDRKPIRLGGETYRKGLGTFSGMKLTYRLGGEFSKFAALVGIDDADVNHHGNVTVRLLADGKERFRKAGLTRKSGPVKVKLSVAGVDRLTLVVDFGENMHFGDLTDWADAHLIR